MGRRMWLPDNDTGLNFWYGPGRCFNFCTCDQCLWFRKGNTNPEKEQAVSTKAAQADKHTYQPVGKAACRAWRSRSRVRRRWGRAVGGAGLRHGETEGEGAGDGPARTPWSPGRRTGGPYLNIVVTLVITDTIEKATDKLDTTVPHTTRAQMAARYTIFGLQGSEAFCLPELSIKDRNNSVHAGFVLALAPSPVPLIRGLLLAKNSADDWTSSRFSYYGNFRQHAYFLFRMPSPNSVSFPSVATRYERPILLHKTY